MKEELVETLAKLNVSKEEAEKLYDKTYKQFKEAEIEENDDELKKLVYNNVIGKYFKRKRMLDTGKYEEFTSMIIAESRITDYGAQRKYDNTIKDYKEASEEKQIKMVNDQLVRIDEGKIVPLDQREWSKGKPIVPADSKVKEIFALTKIKDKKILTVIRQNDNFEFPIKQGDVVKFYGNKNKTSTEDKLIINMAKNIKPPFNVVEHEDAVPVINKFFEDDIIELESFPQWCEKNEGNRKLVWLRGMIFAGDNGREIFISKDALLDETSIHSWANKAHNFIDGAPALICGDVYKNKEGEWRLNTNAIYFDDKYKIPEPQSVSEAEDKKGEDTSEVDEEFTKKGW